MKKLLFVVLFLLMSVVSVDALNLLMFSSSKCSYCQNFIKEVVPEYDKTKYHKVLPLKIIDIDQKNKNNGQKKINDIFKPIVRKYYTKNDPKYIFSKIYINF